MASKTKQVRTTALRAGMIVHDDKFGRVTVVTTSVVSRRFPRTLVTFDNGSTANVLDDAVWTVEDVKQAVSTVNDTLLRITTDGVGNIYVRDWDDTVLAHYALPHDMFDAVDREALVALVREAIIKSEIQDA